MASRTASKKWPKALWPESKRTLTKKQKESGLMKKKITRHLKKNPWRKKPERNVFSKEKTKERKEFYSWFDKSIPKTVQRRLRRIFILSKPRFDKKESYETIVKAMNIFQKQIIEGKEPSIRSAAIQASKITKCNVSEVTIKKYFKYAGLLDTKEYYRLSSKTEKKQETLNRAIKVTKTPGMKPGELLAKINARIQAKKTGKVTTEKLLKPENPVKSTQKTNIPPKEVVGSFTERSQQVIKLSKLRGLAPEDIGEKLHMASAQVELILQTYSQRLSEYNKNKNNQLT